MRHLVRVVSAIIALGAGGTVIAAAPAHAQVIPRDPCRVGSGFVCTEWTVGKNHTITWNSEQVSTPGLLDVKCVDIPAPAPGAVAIAVDNETGAIAQPAAGSCPLPVPLLGDEVLPRTEQQLLIPDSGYPLIMFL
jgi:hypothetical protein